MMPTAGQHARDIITALAWVLVIIGLAAGLLMHAAHLARRRRYNRARRRAVPVRELRPVTTAEDA
jgi:hypothetical protein